MTIAPKTRTWLSSVILVVGLGGLLALLWFSPLRPLLTDPEQLRHVVLKTGGLMPVVMVAIHVIQVVIAPIPGQAIDVANGYLFGWAGVFVSLIGIGLGSALAVALARRFGRPLVEILVTPKGLASVRQHVRRSNQWIFFFLFLLPGTPDDLLCFAIGLSSIPFGRALLITLLGRAPGVAAAVMLGATGQSLNVLELTILSIAISILLGFILWHWPNKQIQALKNQR